MTFYPAPHVIRAEMRFAWANQQVENVLNFDVGHTPVLTDADLLGAALVTWWTGSIHTGCPSNLSLQQIVLTNMEDGDGFKRLYTAGLPVSGTSNSPALPNSVTLAARLSTDNRGRNFTGRIYHIGLCESQVVENTADPTFLASLTLAYEELINNPVSMAGLLSVVSYWIAGVRRPTALVSPVTHISIDPVIDAQRRRLPGRGR